MSAKFTPGPWTAAEMGFVVAGAPKENTRGVLSGHDAEITAKIDNPLLCASDEFRAKTIRAFCDDNPDYEPEDFDADESLIEEVEEWMCHHNNLLIAAAPDMYAALELAEQFMNSLQRRVSLEVWRDLYEPKEAVRAALAKARGEA